MNVNIATSSNGCESGWTVYLDESYITRSDNVGHHLQSYRLNSGNDNEYDNEDLSMVSDASSGPPHCLVQEDDQHSYNCSIRRNYDNNYNGCCCSTNSDKSSKKSAKKSSKEHNKLLSSNKHKQHQHQHQHQHQQYHLDDTASSPAIATHSQMYGNPSNVGFTQNFSATHFEGNASFSNHYGFWQSSHVKNTDYSAEPVQLSRRTWE